MSIFPTLGAGLLTLTVFAMLASTLVPKLGATSKQDVVGAVVFYIILIYVLGAGARTIF